MKEDLLTVLRRYSLDIEGIEESYDRILAEPIKEFFKIHNSKNDDQWIWRAINLGLPVSVQEIRDMSPSPFDDGDKKEIIAGVILNRWYLHLPVSKELVDWAWEEIRGTQSYTEYAEQFKQRIPEELLCEHTKK